NSPTLVASAGAATKLIDTCRATNEITIEAWIKPQNTTQSGPARIVSLSADPYNRNFTLGQGGVGVGGTSYNTRLRTTTTGNNGALLSLTAGIINTALSHVVYTRDTTGLAKFYLNGVEVGSRADIGGDLSNWDTSFRFGLANELTQDRPWLGTFYKVAIYDLVLSAVDVSQNFNAGSTSEEGKPGKPVYAGN
ncbi:MAG: LamG domain-containing protein, partial [Candidatus Poribacteria bacterium]|nr:LamG domain-containing protein [Candidatus Poribacteria bacterium]